MYSARRMWMVVPAAVVMVVLTALTAAAQSELYLPLVGGGPDRVTNVVEEPEIDRAADLLPDVVDESDERVREIWLDEEPLSTGSPTAEEEVLPDAYLQDSDGPYDQPDDQGVGAAAVNAFDAGIWRVRNKLGIGTETPAYRLDIFRKANRIARIRVRNTGAGDNAQADLVLTTGVNQAFTFKKYGAGFSVYKWNGINLAEWTRLRSDTNAKGVIITTGGSQPLVLGTNDRERMRITANGRVGFGTRTPNANYLLHVNGGSTSAGMLVQGHAACCNGMIRVEGGYEGIEIDDADTDGLEINNPGTDGVEVNNANANGVEIYSPGSSGMRVVSPGRNGLYVSDSGRDGLVVDSPGLSGLYVANPTNEGVYIDNPGQDGVQVNGAAVDGVYVDRPGDDGVHVNRAADDGILVEWPGGDGVKVVSAEVSAFVALFNQYTGKSGVYVRNGDIRIDDNGKFIDTGTTLNVPDYVFEDDYPLMSLGELRSFVAREKHLPNMPGEDEIRANGLDLSDFNMRLLEKVEELTLYTLAQEQRIADLEARLTAVESGGLVTK